MSVDGMDNEEVVYACDECGERLRAGEHFRCFDCQQQWLESFCTRKRDYTESQPEGEGTGDPMSIKDQLARAQQQLQDCAQRIHNQRAEIVRLEAELKLENGERSGAAAAFEGLLDLYGELKNAVCDSLSSHVECVEAAKSLNKTVEEQRWRLAVKCEHPNVESCAKLWQEDANQRQLAAVFPELVEEFSFGCDTVEHLATALVAARTRCKTLEALH